MPWPISPAPSTPTLSIRCAMRPPPRFVRFAAGGDAVCCPGPWSLLRNLRGHRPRARRRAPLASTRGRRPEPRARVAERQEQSMSLIVTEDRGPVRHVVLNRPEKRNAMNQALLRELAQALRAAAGDAAVQCVLLRGEGAVFSAGVDLGELGSFAGDTSVLRP